MKLLITGAAGNAGQAVCRAVARDGFALRLADMATPPPDVLALGEFVRCDTRTADDVRRVVEGVDAVVHLAAWHSGHRPPVSDPTLFAVNVDGTFHVIEACRAHGVQGLVFASSMAYGWGSVYSVTKVIGEDLCRCFQQMTGAPVVTLRYHAFVPGPYLEYGARLLRNGVDRQDVAAATRAALLAVVEKKVTLFRTIVHTDHGMPTDVVAAFRDQGPDWCEAHVPGARRLIEKYQISLPERVEQHDLSEAAQVLGWRPSVGFLDFLRDLKQRDERGEDIAGLRVPGELPLPAAER
jgi:nucleoside-diphosphate-sugar epimerase